MDSLIAVGSGAALIYGIASLFAMAYAMGHGQWETVRQYSENLYFESAVMILTLITLGEFPETNALRLRRFRPDRLPNQKCAEKDRCEINQEVHKMETIIMVNGMMCAHCKARVEQVCRAVSGVTDAVVDLQAKHVTVTGDADIAEVKKAILDAGYEVEE